MPAPLLEMQGISKRFGATQALTDVSLEVAAGEVLALIGENGAGKSTLMKVLSGAYQADTGTMRLAGAAYAPAGPHAARLAGVAMIYQELTIAPDLSVEDNVMLGQERSCFAWLDRREQRRAVHRVLELLGHPELDPRAVAGRLSVAAQQLVEIARALVHDAKVIVFDEPTSALTARDARKLFDVIRRLKASGMGVVYISHFLEELHAVGDRYAVLRDGRSVAGGKLHEASEAQIVAQMVGRSVDDLFPRVPHTPGDEVLRLEGLTGKRMPADVTFSLRRGEILGIAGLVGSGRSELLRSLFALEPIARGSVRVGGLEPRATPRARIGAGLGFVSEDRKGEGLAQQCSIADNMTWTCLTPYSRLGWLRLSRRRAAVVDWIGRLRIKCAGPDQPVVALSGGNQQKVAIARIMHQQADILLLDEPTRGIDVGTKAEIYRLIGEAAAAGKAVIFVSSYLPELLGVCDVIGVMARGMLRAIRPAGDWSQESLMAEAVAAETSEA